MKKNNSIILRHKMFPFMIAFNDPQKNWDEIAKDRIVEEIKRDGFDNFTVINHKDARLFLGSVFANEEDKKNETP